MGIPGREPQRCERIYVPGSLYSYLIPTTFLEVPCLGPHQIVMHSSHSQAAVYRSINFANSFPKLRPARGNSLGSVYRLYHVVDDDESSVKFK